MSDKGRTCNTALVSFVLCRRGFLSIGESAGAGLGIMAQGSRESETCRADADLSGQRLWLQWWHRGMKVGGVEQSRTGNEDKGAAWWMDGWMDG